MKMKIRYVYLIIGIALIVFVVAQSTGLGGVGGSLNITSTTNVPNHAWKNCLITNDYIFRYEVLSQDNLTESLVYQGNIIFLDRDNCTASLGKHEVYYGGKVTAKEALTINLKEVWYKEFNRNYTKEPNLRITGSYRK